ncbi:hypothetical protein RUM44_005669 [Polyplax serrata]|uniref:Hydroxylysine kinase n=1 Tax=Polyplax serrata TaxID=468196 RepID=A0ABR1AW79_POLSC
MYSTNSKEGIIRFHLDEEEAEMVLEKHYGLKGGELKKLIGFDDLNFKYMPKENVNPFLNNLCQDGYIMKVTNYLDSKNNGFTEAQNNLMLFLKSKNISAPVPVKTLSGEYFVKVKIPTKLTGSLQAQREHNVRLLEFIPGTTMKDVPLTYSILFNFGTFIANFDEALKGFSHSAYETHSSIWHLRSMPNIIQHLEVVQNSDQRHLVRAIVDAFIKDVLAVENNLNKGLIHGDFNENNVLMSKCESGNWEVSAVLDFGDSHLSCYLFELAISLCYITLECKKNGLEPIAGAGHLLAGYLKVLPNFQMDYKLLKIATCARFCQSLVLGLKAHCLNPDNTYVLGTQALGWSLVNILWETPIQEFTKELNSVISSYGLKIE